MTTTLITGADGHVGRALASRLLDSDAGDLLLLVRAGDDGEKQRKLDRLGALARSPNCRILFADLTSPDPYAAVDGADVETILHCAARIDFNVDRASALAVNVEGTARTLDFAARCGRLRRFGLISSIYAAGLRDGPIDEEPLDEAAEFANYYEWSKWQAERLVVSRPGLPWQIFRLSTIVGDGADGNVGQQNAIHNTLRMLYYGLLSVLPGHRDTRVYTVTTDFVTRAIDELRRLSDDHCVFHLSDSGEAALTLGEFADIAYAAFRADPEFARQRILPPLLCDYDAFVELADGVDRFGSAIAQSLGSVLPFARQLYSDKDIRTARTTAALQGLRTHDARTLLGAVARNLVQTRWGLRPTSAITGTAT